MADPKKEMRWNIDIKSIVSPDYLRYNNDKQQAEMLMKRRTARYDLYGMLAKNKSIHEHKGRRGQFFSEGSTQYILRKSLATTLQRVPDGELQTQYDKLSVEHVQTEYIFNNKVCWSEFEGIDMFSNLTNTFKTSFIYGYTPVRTGFEKDYDNDVRVSYNIEHWADVAVDTDCRDIRRPKVVYHRSYISKAECEALLTPDGNVFDSTYNADAIKYVLDHELFTAKQWESEKLADRQKGATSQASLELSTEYRRGSKEFVTYIPSIGAEFRRVPNYDPRLGIPWNFFVLEPDPDYPLGLSQIEFLLADQQFQDLFQTSAYKNLLLAMEPPIMVSGWDTNPSSYVFEPRKIWNLGNNPNNAKVEPVKIENQILSSFLNTREGVAAGMLRQLNVMDGTISADSAVPGFSGTPQGVEAQQRSKDISINQYQKRIESFFSDWANQALRMYMNAMKGKHELTVDEETRRKLADLGAGDLIKGDKIVIDFSQLSTDLLEFKVRTGSLIERKEDKERKALNEMILPLTQNLNGWSEANKAIIENEILIPATKRLLELSDTDIGNRTSEALEKLMRENDLTEMKEMMAGQQQQIDEQGQQIGQLTGELPPSQAQLPPGLSAVPGTEGQPGNPLSPTELGAAASPSAPPLAQAVQNVMSGNQGLPSSDMSNDVDLLNM